MVEKTMRVRHFLGYSFHRHSSGCALRSVPKHTQPIPLSIARAPMLASHLALSLDP